MTVIHDGRPRQVEVRGKEWQKQHDDFRLLAELTGEWAGIPQPVEGFDVKLENRHRYASEFERILNERNHRIPADGEIKITCRNEDIFHVVNHWWSARRHAWVYLLRDEDTGKTRVYLDPADRTGGRRLTFALGTIGVSQVWDLDAEYRARDKLRTMITPHLYAMYELTGSFLYTSPRSRVHYMLRRCRPTVAMVPSFRGEGDDDAHMRILAVLCLHPLGYYADTWAGSMVPTDDVIAHLLYIKSDEAGFWRRANQHEPQSAEAGL